MGLVLVDSFYYDFKINRGVSFLGSLIVPLVLSLINNDFEKVISLTGGILISLLSIMVIIAAYDARKKFGVNKSYEVPGGVYLMVITAIIMLLGLVYTIIYI